MLNVDGDVYNKWNYIYWSRSLQFPGEADEDDLANFKCTAVLKKKSNVKIFVICKR